MSRKAQSIKKMGMRNEARPKQSLMKKYETINPVLFPKLLTTVSLLQKSTLSP